MMTICQGWPCLLSTCLHGLANEACQFPCWFWGSVCGIFSKPVVVHWQVEDNPCSSSHSGHRLLQQCGFSADAIFVIASYQAPCILKLFVLGDRVSCLLRLKFPFKLFRSSTDTSSFRTDFMSTGPVSQASHRGPSWDPGSVVW